jgi:DNA-binding NarL/FixJ family response regulator
MTFTILIADDDELMRGMLREYLSHDPTLKVVAETANGSEAVALAKQHHPDIVLMDLSLEGIDGLQATKLIKKHCPNTEIIILTSYEFADLRERARESPQLVQSSAFLGKHQISTQLLPVINSLTAGRKQKEQRRNNQG